MKWDFGCSACPLLHGKDITGRRGEINQAGIDFYKDVFNECHKYGIEPLVTIFHFDLPLALQVKYGSWKDRRMGKLM